jgi:hypothetical protein
MDLIDVVGWAVQCRGFTPLNRAIFQGHLECVRLLLERGARVSASVVSLGVTSWVVTVALLFPATWEIPTTYL